MNIYSEIIKPGNFCFDIGANVGNRTKMFLDCGARVLAVEPQPRCVVKLMAIPGLVKVEPYAVGAKPGKATMHGSNAHTISSMSEDWIAAVQSTGRFTGCNWDHTYTVDVVTLDQLIAKHGRPNFIKIDVEGYEYEVLCGLSKPVPMISIEFTPEYLDATEKCLKYLQGLGNISVNYSLGESLEFALDKWVSPELAMEHLSKYKDDHVVFGDVYIRSN